MAHSRDKIAALQSNQSPTSKRCLPLTSCHEMQTLYYFILFMRAILELLTLIHKNKVYWFKPTFSGSFYDILHPDISSWWLCTRVNEYFYLTSVVIATNKDSCNAAGWTRKTTQSNRLCGQFYYIHYNNEWLYSIIDTKNQCRRDEWFT